MTAAHLVPIVALGAACVFTGAVLAFVLRAQRLNRMDRCGLCGDQLALESRFRFHGRTVCPPCSQRVRFVKVPRVGRVAVLLMAWFLGLAALVTLIGLHDPEALLWGPLFAGLVLSAVIAGAVPPLSKARNHTATTLRRLHALLHAERAQPGEPDGGS